jgi:cytochrome c-type biogenesis protein CcmE
MPEIHRRARFRLFLSLWHPVCSQDHVMSPTRVKLLVGGFILASAVSYLAVAGVKKGWVYLMPVDQFTSQSEFHDRRVRLNGKVGTENLEIDRAGLLANFDLMGQTSQVRVSYKGVIPDMFRAHHEVVVEGQIGAGGVFQADVLMTKCASKYDIKDGHPPVSAQASVESQP